MARDSFKLALLGFATQYSAAACEACSGWALLGYQIESQAPSWGAGTKVHQVVKDEVAGGQIGRGVYPAVSCGWQPWDTPGRRLLRAGRCGGRAASCGKAQGSVHARHQRPSVKYEYLRLIRGVRVGFKIKAKSKPTKIIRWEGLSRRKLDFCWA